jgi:SH3 domain protein
VKRILFASLFCLCASTASSQTSTAPTGDTRYIRDSLGVNLRSENSDGGKVVAENLRSGTLLQLLQADDKSGFARVRTQGGQEGWLSSRLLQKEPTFEMKYKEAQARLAQLEPGGGSMQPRITEQPRTDEGLRSDNSRLAHELDELKTLSAKAVDIDQNNKALIKKNELLQTEVDKLSAENDRLSGQAAREEWTRTLIAITLGVLLTLALPRLVPHKKRYSDW